MSTKTTLTACIVLLLLGAASRAQESAPTFSDPTNITNVYAPFEPGAVKVYRGRTEGVRTAAVETHLDETRTFTYNGLSVECCILEQREFKDGVMVELAVNYVAQDDMGNVHYFGEIAWVDDDGEDGEEAGPEDDSWLVGPPQAGDPEGIHFAAEPAMFMPVEPRVGDSFNQESFAGGGETLTVIDVGGLRVPAGKYSHALKLRETDIADPGPAEYVWIVPGVGIVKERDRNGKNRLVLTSLQEQTEAVVGL